MNASGDIRILWAALTFVWALAVYLEDRSPSGLDEARTLPPDARSRWHRGLFVRAVIAAVAVFGVGSTMTDPEAQSGVATVGAALVIAAAAVLHPWARRWVAKRSHHGRSVVWFEVLALAGTPMVLLAVLTSLDVHTASITRGPWPRVADLACIGTALVFLGAGANHMIRAILDGYRLVPSRPVTETVLPSNEETTREQDAELYNGGRLIGTLERSLLLILAVLNAFEAMALVLAAKGLVRFRRISRDDATAEYFLVGNLASLLIALACAMVLRLARSWVGTGPGL